MNDALAWGIIGFTLGLAVGVWGEGAKWRANAKTYIRHASWGRIYKVEYADKEEKDASKRLDG